MAKVKIQGHASGTGILTVTAPNTSTDRTITLPDATGTLLNSDGDGSSLTGVGVAGITSTADATAITIDSSENVGIDNSTGFGTYSGTGVKYSKGDGTFFVGRAGGAPLHINRETNQGDMIVFNASGSSIVKLGTVGGDFTIGTYTGGNTERLRITDTGLGLSQFTAKCWIQADQSNQSINDSHNVSGVADGGTGETVVTFANAMSNDDYSVTSGGPKGTIHSTSNRTTTSFNLRAVTYAGSNQDEDGMMATVFGD